MSKLVENVWAHGEGYGPGFNDRQPPAEVAAGLPAHVWGEDGSGARETTSGSDVAGSGGTDAPGGGSDQPRDPNPSLDGLDKDGLLALAKEDEVEVDRRWGEKRIREAIEAHRKGGA